MNIPTYYQEHILPIVPDALTDYLNDNGFFSAPASTKYHGNYEGGLYNHSRIVTETLVELTKNNKLEWQNPRSPYIVGMFHDLCKIDSYRKNGDKWEYNTDAPLNGHGDKSVILLLQHIALTDEEIMCIRYHMGAFTDEKEWNYYSRAVENYPNVLWTHTADMIASKLFKT